MLKLGNGTLKAVVRPLFFFITVKPELSDTLVYDP
jgi:hypothetical protein